jgi:general secretion pathway protein N
MARWSSIFGLAMLSGAGLCTGWISASGASTSTTLDILPDDAVSAASAPDAGRVEVGGTRRLTGQMQPAGRLPRSGNPLWSVPLSVLTATQERPLFSASRRPPAKAVIGPRIEPPPPAPVVAKPAEHAPLALIGAVIGDSDAIAVFFDQGNQRIVRLRQGESHAGWMMNSILQREVTLTKDGRTEVLLLPSVGVSPASETNGMPIVPAQASGNTGTPYVPFIPRHTPKNGEPDGL